MGMKAKLASGLTSFGALYRRHVFTGNVITSAVLMSIGDLMEQSVSLRPTSFREIDWARNFRLTITGAGMGVINHHYYKIIDRMFPTVAFKHVMIKVISDQIIASPICIAFLFYCDGALLGMTEKQIRADLRNKFNTIYIADCSMWPPVQYINFRFVDAKYRVLFLNTTQMFYNILLSHLKYYEAEEGPPLKKEDPKKIDASRKKTDPREKLGTRFNKTGEK